MSTADSLYTASSAEEASSPDAAAVGHTSEVNGAQSSTTHLCRLELLATLDQEGASSFKSTSPSPFLSSRLIAPHLVLRISLPGRS